MNIFGSESEIIPLVPPEEEPSRLGQIPSIGIGPKMDNPGFVGKTCRSPSGDFELMELEAEAIYCQQTYRYSYRYDRRRSTQYSLIRTRRRNVSNRTSEKEKERPGE